MDEVAEHAELFENEHLVVIHLSRRYRKQEAQKILRQKLPPDLMKRVILFA